MGTRVKLSSAIIIILIAILILFIPLSYIYYSNFGILGEQAVGEVLETTPEEERIIKVYTEGVLLYEFSGYYKVERNGNNFIVRNFLNGEEISVINLYGNITIVNVPIGEEKNIVN